MTTRSTRPERAATGSSDIQLVLAGPGSGKTRRSSAASFICRTGRRPAAHPGTHVHRKAADEMEVTHRDALGPPAQHDIMVATFHGYSFRHLRRNRRRGTGRAVSALGHGAAAPCLQFGKMWWNETKTFSTLSRWQERLLDAEQFADEINTDNECWRARSRFSASTSARSRRPGHRLSDMVPRLVRAMDGDRDYAASITGAATTSGRRIPGHQSGQPIDRRFVTAAQNSGRRDDDQTLMRSAPRTCATSWNSPKNIARPRSCPRPQLRSTAQS